MSIRVIRLIGVATIIAFFITVFGQVPASAAPSQNCAIFETGSFPAETSIDLSFSCDQPETVYFGVCDSGGVEDDDLLNVVFNGGVISHNFFHEGIEETNVGSADVDVGTYTVSVRSLNPGVGFATYTLAVTPDIADLAEYLWARCGGDFIDTSINGGECTRSVPVFIEEPAPSSGTLRLMSRFGEMNREEGITLKEWKINAGDRVNNSIARMPAPDYARLWWQPTGDDEWQLLPSQYWHGGGSTDSEYGLSCDNGIGTPSYHTAFSKGIPASEVPVLKR